MRDETSWLRTGGCVKVRVPRKREWIVNYTGISLLYSDYISYLLLYNKLPPNLVAKNNNCLLSHSVCGSEIQRWLSWEALALSVSWDGIEMSAGPASSQGLTRAMESASKMAHSCRYWQWSSAPYHKTFMLQSSQLGNELSPERVIH